MNAEVYTIATGCTRTAKKWYNEQVSWGDLKDRLRHRRTPYTLKEYQALPKAKQGLIKDVGGFVGGELVQNGGPRTNENLLNRTLLTLDIDHATALPRKISPWYAIIIYSTHSHTPEAPRYRVVAPLSRPCTPLEYQAVAHRMAEGLYLNAVDLTSCEPARLMYWAAAPKDAEVYYYAQDGEPVDVDRVLETYNDYTDPKEWATTENRTPGRPRNPPKGNHAESPRSKHNIVGAWCRRYDCYDVLEELSDLYTPASFGRYTRVGASSWGGMCVYQDGDFCYSFHESDPLGGQLLNAWDLYRLARFAHLDKGANKNTRIDRLPSYTAMVDLALKDPKIHREMATGGTQTRGKAQPEEDDPEDRQDWRDDLETDKNGRPLNSPANYALILRNDHNLIRGAVWYDDFRGEKIVRGKLPWQRPPGDMWTDADTAAMVLYLDEHYHLKSREYALIALEAVLQDEDYRINIVTDYIERAQWDGVSRVDTFFVDFLGVQDTQLARAITRKSLAACVARAYTPGVKYDQITVIIGAQGIGKSSILLKLAGGGDLLMDSFSMDSRSNKMQESVRGAWIVEIPELEGFYKQDMNTIKSFVSKQFDIYRPAYGREQIKVPRTCVFFATTNDSDFLRDSSGNRRFWLLRCLNEPRRSLEELTPEEVAQVWAEAKIIYDNGEPLYLNRDQARELAKMQTDYDTDAATIGELVAYLNVPLPRNWEDYARQERRAYFDAWREGVPYYRTERGASGALVNTRVEGTEQRQYISAVEVLNEFFRGDLSRARYDTRGVNGLLRKLPGWVEDCRKTLSGGYGRQVCFLRCTQVIDSQISTK